VTATGSRAGTISLAPQSFQASIRGGDALSETARSGDSTELSLRHGPPNAAKQAHPLRFAPQIPPRKAPRHAHTSLPYSSLLWPNLRLILLPFLPHLHLVVGFMAALVLVRLEPCAEVLAPVLESPRRFRLCPPDGQLLRGCLALGQVVAAVVMPTSGGVCVFALD